MLIAPGYEDGALEVLQQKEAIRILCEEERRQPDPRERDVKRVLGGLLIQDRDGDPEPREIMEVVTKTRAERGAVATTCSSPGPSSATSAPTRS